MTDTTLHDVIIVGAGPAGLAAAHYTSRDRFSTLVMERMTVGGQMFTTWDVENYPGFEQITGPDLSEKFEAHARKFGAVIEPMADVTGFTRGDDGVVTVTTTDGDHRCRSLLIATGATWNKLGIPGEDELRGKGVSYCATCDGAFFRDKPLVVIGGGNTALDEGLFLTKYASSVTLLHRRDQLRGDKILQERFLTHEKTNVVWNAIPEAVVGTTGVEAVRIHDKVTGAVSEVPCKGVFVFVGTSANTDFLKGLVELDQWGGVVTDRDGRTSVDGVFAAGDCVAAAPRQIAAAVGDGVRAALAIKAHLEHS